MMEMAEKGLVLGLALGLGRELMARSLVVMGSPVGSTHTGTVGLELVLGLGLVLEQAGMDSLEDKDSLGLVLGQAGRGSLVDKDSLVGMGNLGLVLGLGPELVLE
mmetsp:Transcript_33352/g.76842  ORF Transcript_33352/g.76842 Transcript_33352/m.76842 type:complete len:105 (+) Transcript_33352:586-900(+)